MIKDLIAKNRTVRRFVEREPVALDTLRDLVDLARLSASGGNLQPLRFILSCDRQRNDLIFPHLAWAAYLKGWPGPAQGERPAAYIVLLSDTTIQKSPDCDAGIACQSILLGAVEKGLAGCILGSIKRDSLRKALGIPAPYAVLLVVALGKPAEKVVIETVPANGDIKYWRDPKSVHHVPKRRLDDIILP